MAELLVLLAFYALYQAIPRKAREEWWLWFWAAGLSALVLVEILAWLHGGPDSPPDFGPSPYY